MDAETVSTLQRIVKRMLRHPPTRYHDQGTGNFYSHWELDYVRDNPTAEDLRAALKELKSIAQEDK